MTAALIQPGADALIPAKAEAGLRASVFDDWSKIAGIEREWDALAESTGADASLCPAYARVWWKHYGRGRLRIICIWDDSHGAGGPALLGVLPMFVQTVMAGAVPVRVARLLATDSTITVTSPPVVVSRAEEVFASATEHLLNVDRCDAVTFGPMQGDTPLAEAIRRAAQRSGLGTQLSERAAGVCTRFDLPATFDDYMASLEKRQRGNLRRDMNQVAKHPQSRVRVVTDPAEIASVFEQFITMHTAQWTAEGRPGHFGDWPRAGDFSREAVAALAPLNRVALVGLEMDGVMVCWEWCYVLGSRSFWKLPARAVGSEWDKLGLGRLGMANMLQAMIGRGVREVEAGPGHYDYKCKHGATEHPFASFLIVRNSLVSRVKVRCLERFSDLLHLAYYRAWRLKFAPKLGLKSGPLVRWWIRTRP